MTVIRYLMTGRLIVPCAATSLICQPIGNGIYLNYFDSRYCLVLELHNRRLFLPDLRSMMTGNFWMRHGIFVVEMCFDWWTVWVDFDVTVTRHSNNPIQEMWINWGIPSGFRTLFLNCMHSIWNNQMLDVNDRFCRYQNLFSSLAP